MALEAPGSRCTFGVIWKSFEISIDEVRRKLVRKTCERGQGSSSQISFGAKGLALLVEGVKPLMTVKPSG